MKQITAALSAIAVLATNSLVLAEDKDATFTRLDANHDGRLSRKEFLAGSITPPKPPAPPTVDNVVKEFKTLNEVEDSGISFPEFRKAIAGGRLVLPGNLEPRAAFDSANSGQEGEVLTLEEYRAARQRRLFAFQEVEVETFKARVALEQDRVNQTFGKRFVDSVSVTASGLGDKKAKGPATLSWVRQRVATGPGAETTSRWEVDAKVEADISRLLEWKPRGLIPTLSGRAEARIVDYNSREADEHKGALNHLRYALGGRWGWSTIPTTADGLPVNSDATPFISAHFIHADFEYETDPSEDYRNLNAKVYWEPVLRTWRESGRFLGGFLVDPELIIQPLLGVQFGKYDKEIANKLETIPGSQSLQHLGDGLERVSFLQKRSHVITDEEIARAFLNVNLTLRLNQRLFLNGEYKMVAELNGENRFFHFGKVSLDAVLAPFEDAEIGSGLTFSLSYLVGQDSPTFERTDIFTAGFGLEF
jgi:hypothetical protein